MTTMTMLLVALDDDQRSVPLHPQDESGQPAAEQHQVMLQGSAAR